MRLLSTAYIKNTSLLILLLIMVFLGDVIFGSVNLFSLDQETTRSILWDIRIPKALTALVAGSVLALCGLLMQSLFRNPLAGPYVLGISSGAGMFVAVAMMALNVLGLSSLYFLGKGVVTLFSIVGALLVTLMILFVSNKSKSNITVLLVGVMLSQIFGAIQGLIEFLANAESLKNFTIWSMGSVGNVIGKDFWILIPISLLLITGSFFLVKPLNAFLLNETYAINLGINVKKLRLKVIFITAILTGIITAFCGPIAFVGISVPIMSRLLFKTPHHFHQITYVILLGAVTLLFCDMMAQIISTSLVIPINTMTTIVGSPVVIYLIFKTRFSQS